MSVRFFLYRQLNGDTSASAGGGNGRFTVIDHDDDDSDYGIGGPGGAGGAGGASSGAGAAGGAAAGSNEPAPAAGAAGAGGAPELAAPVPGPALGDKGREAVVSTDDILGADGGKKDGNGEPATQTPEQVQEHQTLLNEFAEAALGLTGGMVQFEGEDAPVPFGQLTAAEQRDVFEQQKAKLPTPQERETLLAIKRAGGIDAYVRNQMERLENQPANSLSDDDLHRRAIRSEYGASLNDQEVEQELAHRKTSPTFAKQTEALRGTLTKQDQQRQQQLQQEEARVFVDTIRDMPSIAGFSLSDEHREAVLAEVLTPDPKDPTQSMFAARFEDPAFMLEMAFLYKFANPIFRSLKSKIPKETAKPAEGGQQQQQQSTNVPGSTPARRRVVDVTAE